ncbi:hypothetical protein N7456_002759 [Penicillium angulare]|uniref:Six-hairpin glycosidase n=1 Tax=Penicillium angulare TaxID=116970 RepID=A0A9W9KQ74_9EURO|nr:hypothetical protein N7456_002759 [Penicillium angulare]
MSPHMLDSPSSTGDKVKVKPSDSMSSPSETSQFGGLGRILSELFSENNFAKIISTAEALLEDNNPPTKFPETVPQRGPHCGEYQSRDSEFWTCGFFPGSLYCLLERARRHPGSIAVGGSATMSIKNLHSLEARLASVCATWAKPIKYMSSRTDTHDLGFIIQPAMKRHWELYGDSEIHLSLTVAAESLASRYDKRVGAIRSWNGFRNTQHDIQSMNNDFIVIIDSLCNLDLLFFASSYSQAPHLGAIAHAHATKLLNTHLRKESGPDNECYYSTYHGVNFSPTHNGAVKKKFTAQGYCDESTWSRGQAWAILGYAQTFGWTKSFDFLDAAIGLANYFILRMEQAPETVDENGFGRYVPLWDFDAPITNTSINGTHAPLRDVSAGLVAANGMLILYGYLAGLGRFNLAKRFLDYVIKISEHTIALAYNRNEMRFDEDHMNGELKIEACDGPGASRFDSILERSTANFNENHADRSWNHGLVYADYYFLELGNRLLDMGLV